MGYDNSEQQGGWIMDPSMLGSQFAIRNVIQDSNCFFRVPPRLKNGNDV
jgi:hypothetical protein